MRSAIQWWILANNIAVFCIVICFGCGENRPLVSYEGDTSSDSDTETDDTGTHDSDTANDCSNAEIITAGQHYGTLEGGNAIELDTNASCWSLNSCPTTGPQQVWVVELGPFESLNVVAGNFEFTPSNCSIAGYLVSSCTNDSQASCSTPDITCLGEQACIQAIWNTGELVLNMAGNESGGTFWVIFDTQQGCVVNYQFELSITD